jgi:hypothetical protein
VDEQLELAALTQGRGDALRDLVLDGEDVIDGAVEAERPQVAAGGCVDELGGDAQPLARALHAAFDEVSRIELAADLLDVRRALTHRERRGPGDERQVRDTRQSMQHAFGHPEGDVGVLCVGTQVLERQDRDRPPLGLGRCR